MVMNPWAYSIDKEQAKMISSNWWILLVVGIITTIAGVVILAINWTIQSLAILAGILFIVKGLGLALTPSISGGSRAWNIVIGVLGILVGTAILVFPAFAAISLLVLAIFIGAWLIVWGAVHTVAATSNRFLISSWWLALVIGIASITLGVVALYNPILTLDIAVLVLGIWAIIAGVNEIALSFDARRLPEEIEAIEEMEEAGPRAA